MPLAAFLKEETEERLFLSQVERPLVDRKNKPFGNLLPFEMQVIIIFWTQCFMTNDRRKKMNGELTRLPCCLRTAIPMSVAFSFSSGYKRFSSATEKKPYPRFYGCPLCFRRKTKRYSVCLNVRFISQFICPLFSGISRPSCLRQWLFHNPLSSSNIS